MKPIVVLTWKKLALLGACVARRLCEDSGLTPARADLLFALRGGAVLQRDLVLELGVTAPVVSRMLASLEKLGFVVRTRAPYAKHMRVCHLTREGSIAIGILIDAIHEGLPEYPPQWRGEDAVLRQYAKQFWRARVKAPPPSKRDQGALVVALQLAVRKRRRNIEGFPPI